MAQKFYYGGQAVMEGVMMRGQKTAVTVVRLPSGELTSETIPLSPIYTGRMRKTPFVRGIIVLIESLVLGMKSIMYSADVALEEEGEKPSKGLGWLMMAVALIIAVGLFFILPLFLTRLLNIRSTILFNLVDGLIRIAIFVAYLKVMALIPDIRQVFSYHGAEHKTVNAYEAGVPLEIDVVKKYSTAHTRCGTSFLFVVLVISIFVFAISGLYLKTLPILLMWPMLVLSRIVLIPVIAALSYEVIYFGARHTHNPLLHAILKPGLWLQALTTREPNDSQIEVAIAALSKAVTDDTGVIEPPRATASEEI